MSNKNMQLAYVDEVLKYVPSKKEVKRTFRNTAIVAFTGTILGIGACVANSLTHNRIPSSSLTLEQSASAAIPPKTDSSQIKDGPIIQLEVQPQITQSTPSSIPTISPRETLENRLNKLDMDYSAFINMAAHIKFYDQANTAALKTYNNLSLAELQTTMAAESSGRTHIASSSGAIGPWQIMPKTAELYGEDPNGLYTPKAATLCARILNDNLEKYDGNQLLADAYYNVGNKLDRIIEQRGTKDWEELKKRVSGKINGKKAINLPVETIEYVEKKKILREIFSQPEQYGLDKIKSLAPDDGDAYFVKAGETIYSIAKGFDKSVEDLEKVNRYLKKEGYQISEGQLLFIPST